MTQTSFKVLAIIGLIFGISAVGWLSYNQFLLPDDSQIPSSRQYYDYWENPVQALSDGSFAYNQYLEVNFTVNPGEKIYFSYVSTAIIDDSSRPYTELYFYFNVDGVTWSSPFQRIRRWNENDPDGADIRWISVALQHYNTTMSSGDHNCTISIYFYDSLDSVRCQSLFIEVFS